MINKFILQGRIVNYPELKKSNEGYYICEFTIAWNSGRIKLFQDCISYKKTAENIGKYFSKGQEIIVLGQMFTKQWNGKKGEKKSKNKLTVSEIHFCGPKNRLNNPEIIQEEFFEMENEEKLCL